MPPWGFFQAPTERQLRYKEKVAELRKKRNSGLSKEQKEKYMVKTGILSFHSPSPGWDLALVVILQYSQLEKTARSSSSAAKIPVLCFPRSTGKPMATPGSLSWRT